MRFAVAKHPKTLPRSRRAGIDWNQYLVPVIAPILAADWRDLLFAILTIIRVMPRLAFDEPKFP